MSDIDLSRPPFRDQIASIVEEILEKHSFSDILKTWQEIKILRQDMKTELQALRQDMKEETTKIWQEIQLQRESMDRGFGRVQSALDAYSTKTGEDLEQAVLLLMKETLQLENIDPEKIRKEYLVDRDGAVFTINYDTDVDVLLEDGNVYLVEVKSTADNRDVQDLLNKAQLYQHITGREPTQLILVALKMRERNYNFATQQPNMKVLVGEIV
ncbi:MAG TPA: hypothetical protein VKK79_01405 [Candidatus Lokiarchaeia archaeon]|nr:hypothetical protein [Candidatus Lokiarchaeia archaeon]